VATITGTSGNDTLTSTPENDTISALGGNDWINFPSGGYGNDTVDGGTGYDTLDFRPSGGAGIVADYRNGTIVSAAGSVSFSNVERVVGTNVDDQLIGAAGNENLTAAGGDDTLEGGAGNDWLWGGGGVDTFVFRETGTANADNIGDFTAASDRIVLDATVMTALGAEGQLSTGDARFVANSSGTAQDSSDRVVYNTTTRQLFYDADGNGTGAAQLIATLQSGATLSASNIVVEGGGTPPPGGATEGDDVLVGTPGPDTIDGLGGNDQISGLGDDDHLIGGTGNDTLDGGPGDDTLDGGSGDDTYVLRSGEGTDTFIDAGGIDTVISFRVFTSLAAGLENLILRGGPFDAGNDIFTSSGHGNDLDNLIVNERPGSSGLDGGPGDDTLIGSAQGMNWFLFSADEAGNYGDDVVDGNGGGAILLAPGPGVTVDFRTGIMTGGGTGSVSFSNISVAEGSGGADEMIGNDAGVTLYGNAGNDTLVGGAGSDVLSGDGFRSSGTAPEFTIGDDSLSGGAGDDTLDGGRGNDTMDGGEGDDTFLYSFEDDYGNDVATGGAGVDLITIFNLSAVAVDLAAGTMTGGELGGAGSVAFSGIENFEARGVGSSIIGDAGGNLLIGANGDFSGPGTNANDTINGAGGNDTLTGNSGADRFLFDQAPGAANADTITDFEINLDDLVLDLEAMPALGSPGPFAAGDDRFHAAPGAAGGADAEDRVIYNMSTGEVFYDADGNGSGMAQLIATLQGAPALSATDIVVVGEAEPGGSHIVGTEGDDNLIGTAAADLIEGLGGNDSLFGGLGEDELRGGDGNDTLNGRDDPGSLGDSAADTLDGGMGDDAYLVYDLNDSILADPGGIDTVFASRTPWTLGPGLDNLTMEDSLSGGGFSGTGNDLDNVIVGSFEGGTMSGMGGNDTLRGSHNSALRGGDGNDVLEGGRNLFGDAGDDILTPGASSLGATFNLTGGTGADIFVLERAGAAPDSYVILDLASGVDTLRLDATEMPALGASGEFAAGDARFAANGTGTAQDASDRVVYNTATGELWYDADGNGGGGAALIATLQGAPSLAASDIEVVNGTSGGEHIVGTSGNDTLTGTEGDDTIEGLGGNDWINMGPDYGDDVVDGGAGSDTIDFRPSGASGIVADYGTGSIVSAMGTTSFSNVERVVGTHADDHLIGASGGQNLTSAGGHDRLEGRTGNDWLWGGGGNDTFVFRENGTANADNIGDFAVGLDTIALDNAAMTALGADGDFGAGDGRFTANGSGTAQDGGDRVVYNTSTGQLYYDADGSGGGASQLIATLSGAPGLTATDIAVI
jgi:Ca2+-binding RTX toxin-like protein